MSSSNDRLLARLYKQETFIKKAIVDGIWDLEKVSDHLQKLIETPPRIEKFALLVDLGIITVPNNYDHATCLAKFYERHQGGEKKSFNYHDENINDENFQNPTRILKPGDKLRVRAFNYVIAGRITSEEIMAFLVTQKAIHTGMQGLSLVLDQKCDQLPKGNWYASFDKKDRLWADARGRRWVPLVDIGPRDSEFGLGNFERLWNGEDAFLCFTEVEEGFPDDQVRIQGIDPLN